MATIGGPDNIIEDGLIFYVDAANKDSYVSGSSDTFSLINPNITGSLKNDTSFVSNNAGVWDFDGTDDYIGTSYDVASGNKTISFWFKSSYAGYQCVLGGSNDSFILGTFTSQIPMPNGVSYIQGSSSKIFGVTASVTDEYADGNWHHFVYTYDGNSKIYIDSIEKTISYKSGTISSDDIVVIDNLGLGLNRSSYPKFNGNIGPVQIYNKALSDEEVLQNYNALKGRFT